MIVTDARLPGNPISCTNSRARDGLVRQDAAGPAPAEAPSTGNARGAG